jgi:tetratricopeptide (TPR) repeat protein/uncharacterized protein Usg
MKSLPSKILNKNIPIQMDPQQPARLMRFVDALNQCMGLLQQGEHNMGRVVLLQLQAHAPKNLFLLSLEIKTLLIERRLNDAVNKAEEAVPRALKNKNLLAACIAVFRSVGQIKQAEQLLAKAMKAFPKDHGFYYEMGGVQLSSNNKEEAIKFYNKAIALKPDFIMPYWARGRLQGGNTSNEEISAMLRVSERKGLTLENQALLDFSLAWAYEGQDVDKHFEYLTKANNKMSSVRPWQDDAVALQRDQLLNYFDGDFLSANNYVGQSSKTPIFIIGLPRSGTSLIEQVLATHGDVSACGETGAIEAAVHSTAGNMFNNQAFYAWPKSMESQYLRSVDQAFTNQFTFYNIDTEYFTDKSMGLEWYVGLLLKLYPNAKFVHCVRNPMDSVLSMYQLYFSVGMQYTYNLTSIAKTYKVLNSLMEYWKSHFEGRFHTVHYESFVAAQEEETRGLLEFCGLPWEEECLAFYNNQRSSRTASEHQVRKPVYKTAVDRWKPYEKYLREAHEILGT